MCIHKNCAQTLKKYILNVHILKINKCWLWIHLSIVLDGFRLNQIFLSGKFIYKQIRESSK